MSEARLSNLIENAPLEAYTTFGVKQYSHFLIEVTDLPALYEAVEFARDNHLELMVLGSGSNVLFVRDFPGLIIIVKLTGIVQESPTRLRIGAGEDWHALVKWTLANNLFGLENLALIPGTVGAAPIQNIGAYGVEIERFVKRVHVFDTHLAKNLEFEREACDFAYRDSLFKRAPRGRYIVLEVELDLSDSDAPVLTYPALAERFDADEKVTAEQVYHAVCEIRRSKLPDPKVVGNAGSFFKNPVISAEKFRKISEKHDGVPAFPLENGDFYRCMRHGFSIRQDGRGVKRD
jgi:UDP-N-acetylmuramate dehydrogenase